MKFSGRIVYANGLPAPGVRVRVFDRDEPGKGDDDLTTSEGVSGDDGRFTVVYDRARYLDYTVVETTDRRSPLTLDLSPVVRVQHVPDPSDKYRPYLRFGYDHRGRDRSAEASMPLLATTFRLQEALVPEEPFLPSKRGFKFGNSFEGYPVPFTVPEALRQLFVPQGYGLCGGMSAAACDLYLHGRDMLPRKDAPGKRAALHRYLYRRQMDTFGAGRYVLKFYEWMIRPDDTALGTQKATYDGFSAVRAQLDDGMPVVLGLVYVKLSETVEMWQNHQVLAYRYDEPSPGNFRIYVYDPNYPERDNVLIEASVVGIESPYAAGVSPEEDALYGLRCVQRIPVRADKAVRGFFAMPYVPARPPDRLR